MTLSERIGRCLEREGLLEREEEQSYLTEDAASENDLLGNFQTQSITYRIAVGPQAGRKVMTVQTLPACEEDAMPLASVGGFSLHAGVAVKVRERSKLEKLSEGGPTAILRVRRCRKAPDADGRWPNSL